MRDDSKDPEAMPPRERETPVSPDSFRAAMRQLYGGVAIVTTHDGNMGHGMTATAVCSVSAEPPQLLACVNKEASPHDVIMGRGIFAVSILAAGHADLAARFAGEVAPEERFAHGRWRTLATGCPVLADALAVFDCRLAARLDAVSHSIFVGLVLETRHGEGPPAGPLLYGEGAFGTFRGL